MPSIAQRLLLAFACLAIAAPDASALEKLASASQAREQADAALQAAGTGDMEAAIRRLSRYWPAPQSELENLIEQAKLQAPVMKARFGEPLGSEFVRALRGGDSFVRYVYLQRFEHHALYWQITFYRGKDGWMVNNLKYDDDLGDMFEPVD